MVASRNGAQHCRCCFTALPLQQVRLNSYQNLNLLTGVIVITIQWMFWGYSLAYSRTAGPFIGDLANFGMMHVLAATSPGSSYLPEIVFCLYQLLFCICTVMIVVGGTFERGKILPSLVFGWLWATIVYCPIACWTWNANGWLYNLPSLDYAGGGPVHIASGCSALAYALVLGKRKTHGHKLLQRPHNVSMVFTGTVLIWFGWFGFNVSWTELLVGALLICIGRLNFECYSSCFRGSVQHQHCSWNGCHRMDHR